MKQIKKCSSMRKRPEAEAVKDRVETFSYVSSGRTRDVQFFHDPLDQIPHRFTQQRTATLADRRCSIRRPATQTRFIQALHQKTVRQKHAVCVSGLTHAVPQLTVSQSQFLLSISVKGFRAGPTSAIRCNNPVRVPVNPVRDENLSRRLVVFISPQDQDANLVADVRHLHAHGQTPLFDAVHNDRLAIFRRDRVRECDRLLLDALERQLAIELQIADIAAFRSIRVFQRVDVILNFRTRVKTVEREATEHAFFMAPIDHFDGQRRHLLELFAGPLALFFFFETAEVQRVMFAAVRIDVVDDDEILGVHVALLRMIPKSARVLDVLAALGEQRVVDGNDAAIVKFRFVKLLEPLDASLVHGDFVPFDFGEEAVETRLVRGIRHFVGHSSDSFVDGNHQARKVIGKMFPLRFVFEQERKEAFHGDLHDFQRLNDRHGNPFPARATFSAVSKPLQTPIISPYSHFCKSLVGIH